MNKLLYIALLGLLAGLFTSCASSEVASINEERGPASATNYLSGGLVDQTAKTARDVLEYTRKISLVKEQPQGCLYLGDFFVEGISAGPVMEYLSVLGTSITDGVLTDTNYWSKNATKVEEYFKKNNLDPSYFNQLLEGFANSANAQILRRAACLEGNVAVIDAAAIVKCDQEQLVYNKNINSCLQYAGRIFKCPSKTKVKNQK